MKQITKMSLVALALIALVGCNSSGSPTAPQSLNISPSTASVTGGRSVVLTVTSTDGEPVTDGVIWASSNSMIASVDAFGTVTGGYGEGRATITASAGSASGVAVVELARLCADLAPFQGEPNPNEEVQTFAVEFVPGTNAAQLADSLARSYGFSILKVESDGFSAALTPVQAAGVGCAQAVASMTYL